jgi:hypothetical protein
VIDLQNDFVQTAADAAPPEQHLGRRAPEALRDPCSCFAAEVATVSERAVSLENDPVRTTRAKESFRYSYGLNCT